MEKRGGSCILLRNNINFMPVSVTNSKSYEFESCAVELIDYNLIIICIYRTPTASAHIFIQELNKLLKKITRGIKKQIIVCGDWNMDIMKQTKYSKELLSILANYNLVNHITTPTRKLTCIDLIASNLLSVVAKQFCLGLSDHEHAQVITASVRVKGKKRNVNDFWYEKRRDLGSENIKKFIEAMSSLTFNEIYEEQDTEKAFNKFYELVILFYDLCFPIITVRISNKAIKHKWMTRTIKRCCIQKRCLYLKYHLSKSKLLKNMNKVKYRNYSSILKKCIVYAQRIVNHSKLQKSKNICKSAWQIIKDNFNYKNNNNNNLSEIKYNNNTYTKPKIICEKFNDFYINLTNGSNKSNKGNHNVEIPFNSKTIFLSPVNPQDIYKIIKSLKNTASTGYDNISTRVLKDAALVLASPLCHIVNLTLVQGHYPTRLKFSIVKPLYKKGDKKDISNYRPVTLVPILSKILERVMFNNVKI
ncbi:uncharacterized protein LOC123865461 [Maniola jurtina]|uniref:uncharacterized protein LOC123865461 n=1 Tax=Maniola jurtina TaxID=191418 RepID=UPI001E688F5B|nr:uncharacterized protein LOC123865461 [Maniola jurtina]